MSVHGANRPVRHHLAWMAAALCGLAVLLVVQSHGEKAALFAGEAMAAKLRELDLDEDSASYELAEIYRPLTDSCQQIRAEHERARR